MLGLARRLVCGISRLNDVPCVVRVKAYFRRYASGVKPVPKRLSMWLAHKIETTILSRCTGMIPKAQRENVDSAPRSKSVHLDLQPGSGERG